MVGDLVKKLYQLEIEYTVYVMAEDEQDAEGMVAEVVCTESEPGVRADLVHHHNRIAVGWDPECLVYGAAPGTTLESVWPEDPAAGPGRQEHPDQMELLGEAS